MIVTMHLSSADIAELAEANATGNPISHPGTDPDGRMVEVEIRPWTPARLACQTCGFTPTDDGLAEQEHQAHDLTHQPTWSEPA